MKYWKSQIALVLLVIVSFVFVPLNIKAEEEENKYHLGEVMGTKKDNGYTDMKALNKDDPHFGWTLGSFYLSGYTRQTNDNQGNPVFLKNPGDKLALNFVLEQNIDELNGDKALSISEDKNGYDKELSVEETNFGRGTLIVKYTDYQNQSSTNTYVNYLSALVVDADTTVLTFEEGDYEIALDYEIKNNPRKLGPVSVFPTYTNYKITFKFLVRNGNCMVYPMDAKTGRELKNQAFTEDGFSLDLAKSRYLTVDLKKETFDQSANELVEDTRFNQPAKDGSTWTDEGIYTITVKNQYSEAEPTIKKIYVGKNPLLKAYVTTGLTIDDIQVMINNGAIINNNGTLSIQNPTVIGTPEPSTTVEPTPKTVEDPMLAEDYGTDISLDLNVKTNHKISSIPFVIIGLVALIAVILYFKNKKNNATVPPENTNEDYRKLKEEARKTNETVAQTVPTEQPKSKTSDRADENNPESSEEANQHEE